MSYGLLGCDLRRREIVKARNKLIHGLQWFVQARTRIAAKGLFNFGIFWNVTFLCRTSRGGTVVFDTCA
jgi:hypothetical protein